MTPMDTAWQLLKAAYRIEAQRPMFGYKNEVEYKLVDHDDNVLSRLKGELDGKRLGYLLGETPEKYRRQGNYAKLMNAILQQGIEIESDSRNDKSHPFHEKFMSNLPKNVEYADTFNDFDEDTRIVYSRKPTARFPNSDLNIRDHGSIPIHHLRYENPTKNSRFHGTLEDRRLTEFAGHSMFPDRKSSPLDFARDWAWEDFDKTRNEKEKLNRLQMDSQPETFQAGLANYDRNFPKPPELQQYLDDINQR